MRPDADLHASHWKRMPALACCIGILAAIVAPAQAPEGVIPITAEPEHRIRFDDSRVRIYEIFLAGGQDTLMHEHRADNFTVNFTDGDIIVEPLDGAPSTITVRTGDVGFTSTAAGPYAHRVRAVGPADFHGVAIELLSPGPGPGVHPGAQRGARADPPFGIVRENARGRAYRIRLAPGESAGPFARPVSTVVIAISAGRLAETIDDGPGTLWDFETGHFRWSRTGARVLLENPGTTPVDLVELEIF